MSDLNSQPIYKEAQMSIGFGVIVIALLVGVGNYLIGYRGEDDGVDGG